MCKTGLHRRTVACCCEKRRTTHTKGCSVWTGRWALILPDIFLSAFQPSWNTGREAAKKKKNPPHPLPFKDHHHHRYANTSALYPAFVLCIFKECIILRVQTQNSNSPFYWDTLLRVKCQAIWTNLDERIILKISPPGSKVSPTHL